MSVPRMAVPAGRAALLALPGQVVRVVRLVRVVPVARLAAAGHRGHRLQVRSVMAVAAVLGTTTPPRAVMAVMAAPAVTAACWVMAVMVEQADSAPRARPEPMPPARVFRAATGSWVARAVMVEPVVKAARFWATAARAATAEVPGMVGAVVTGPLGPQAPAPGIQEVTAARVVTAQQVEKGVPVAMVVRPVPAP